MTSTIKRIWMNVTSGNRIVESYNKSAYPVQISPNGSLSVRPENLVNSTEARRQIHAVEELQKELKESAK